MDPKIIISKAARNRGLTEKIREKLVCAAMRVAKVVNRKITTVPNTYRTVFP